MRISGQGAHGAFNAMLVASHCRGRECEGERKRRRSNQPELGHDFLLFGFSPESTEGGMRSFQKDSSHERAKHCHIIQHTHRSAKQVSVAFLI
jgi:hypothetical protein